MHFEDIGLADVDAELRQDRDKRAPEGLEVCRRVIDVDDAERVFTELSNDPSISHEFSEVFALHKSLGEDVKRIAQTVLN